MTPRERVLAAINHQETDYAPYCIPIDPEPAQRLDEHFGSNAWRAAIVNHVVTVGADAGREELGGGLWRDKFAVVWRQGGRAICRAGAAT